MIRNKSQFYLDIAILIGIMVLIYYIKIQSTGDTFSPYEGVMAVLDIGK